MSVRHFHWKYGTECSCTFGPHMRVSKTASKLDWLRSRQDLQTPQAQSWLSHLERNHPHADPLYPFLTKEWKNGRLVHDMNSIRDPDTWGSITPGQTRHWMDWYNSNHPTRQGVDVGSKKFQMPDMLNRVKAWEDDMRQKAEEARVKEQADAPVLHQWDDGWSLRNLKPEHLEYEGDTMGHCVGGFGYKDQVRNGNTNIVSLRDPEGRPHATMEMEPRRWMHDETGRVTDRFPDENTVGNEHARALLENGRIIQIQGKSDSVPIPEYQKRFKDWFQTFPEENRPNWEYPTDDITHIGGLVPDAVTTDWSRGYGGRYDETRGEPNARDPDEWAEGGYGPHGDYGLVQPKRPINYLETMKSLVRPQDYQDMEYGWSTYEPKEARALYQEALRRNEIPEMGAAFEPFAEHAMDEYNKASMQEQDYNPEHPSYPGESWDEEPEHWEEVAEQEGVEPQQAWQDARQQYDEAENILADSHPWFKAENDLSKWLEPHMDPEGKYQNTNLDMNDPSSRAALLGFHPNTENVFVKQLPQGAQFMDKDGLHHTVTSTDPLQVNYRAPGWQTSYESETPAFIKHPNVGGTGTFSKTASPLYYRWVFSPASGEVDLSHNWDVDAKLHGEMASDRNEPGLVHGYAYRIGGGWRLTDWESRPLLDPFIVAQVMRTLRGQELSENDWKEAGDWDRTHHGIPL